MIAVDYHRCTYCGGCVSICPVEAITLNETRLVVTEACIDCGDCVIACPIGALRPEGSEHIVRGEPLRRRYDLVVVGAGPGGSTAAQTAAEAGLSVLLIEKRQAFGGAPVRCAEGVGYDQLVTFIEPDPRWIAVEVTQVEITSVAGDEKRILRGADGRGYILERRVFDRVLAERAAQAGAEVRVKTQATGLLIEDGMVREVNIRYGDFLVGRGEVEVEAQVVICADGVEAQVGRWAGLDLQLPLKDTMVCAQYLLAGIDIDPTCTYYTISHQIAPGGYAWVFPKGEGVANVGLGVQADLWQEADALISTSGSTMVGQGVLGFLMRFIEADPRLAQGVPVTLVTGNVPVGLPLAHIVSDGLMVVGDAARQVDPLTGGGIINAMTAGKLAAQVAVEAIEAGDTTAGFLSRYEERWNQSTGRMLRRNYRLRMKFPPSMRTDEQFVRTFVMAVGG